MLQTQSFIGKLSSKLSWKRASADSPLPARTSAMLSRDPNTSATFSSSLFHALTRREFFQVLLHLLPSFQAENQLRLLRALLEFQNPNGNGGATTMDAAIKLAKYRKIASMFFHSGTVYEVRGIPSHMLQVADLERSCESIKLILAFELCKLPEVLAALRTVSCREMEMCDNASGTAARGGGGSTDDDEDENRTESKEDESSGHDRMSNLLLLAKLEHVIANTGTRRELITNLINTGSDASIKIRFVSAVNQYLAMLDEDEEQVRLGRQICNIFVQPGNMFSIQLPPNIAILLQNGDISALQDARVFILQELSARRDVSEMLQRY